MKRLLFIGVGCQVQAVRSVEQHLGLDALYVLGTNCVDNGRRGTLEKFLTAASTRPQDVLHYEFMQDYKVCGTSSASSVITLLCLKDCMKAALAALATLTTPAYYN